MQGAWKRMQFTVNKRLISHRKIGQSPLPRLEIGFIMWATRLACRRPRTNPLIRNFISSAAQTAGKAQLYDREMGAREKFPHMFFLAAASQRHIPLPVDGPFHIRPESVGRPVWGNILWTPAVTVRNRGYVVLHSHRRTARE